MRRYPLLLLTLTITLLARGPQAKAQNGTSLSSPVTPVTELRDVQPTDWAFSALQQLQQRYQCIQGYPDQTFRGEQAITRYEFATFLNRCLSQLEANISAEEQFTIQRLQNEFAPELAILRGKVDAATARVRELELTQFSTTTKLHGIVNFVVTNSDQAQEETGVVLQARSRLNFNTSFTGRDSLLTRLTAGNSITPNLANDFSTSSKHRTSELTQTHQWRGNTDNELTLSKLSYRFPIAENTRAIFTARGGQHADYNTPAINPFFEDGNAGTTTVSTFAQRNPILSLGGGSGLAFSHILTDSLLLGVGYYILTKAPAEASNPEEGLFNGSYSTGVRLKWNVTEQFSLGLNYLHSYFEQGEFSFSDGLSEPSAIVGTAVVNDTSFRQAQSIASLKLRDPFPTVTNAYGVELFWQANPKLAFGGRLGYTDVKAIGEGRGEVWNYAFSVVFPHIGNRGNLGGIIIGAQPYLGSLEGNPQLSNDIPWHWEGFYKWQVSDHIALTPGVIWHLNPNQDDTTADILTSTLRMTIHW